MIRLAVTALCVALWSASALAARSCKPAEAFDEFFTHFVADTVFQEARTATPMRVEESAKAADAARPRVKTLSLRAYLAAYGAFPRSPFRGAQPLEFTRTPTGRHAVSVRAHSPSEPIDRTYHFRRVRGCWKLVSLTVDAP